MPVYGQWTSGGSVVSDAFRRQVNMERHAESATSSAPLETPGAVGGLAACYALLAVVGFVAGRAELEGPILAAQTVALALLAGLARRRPEKSQEALLWVTAVIAGGSVALFQVTGAAVYGVGVATSTLACALWARERRRFLTISALPTLTWTVASTGLLSPGKFVASTFALGGVWLISVALWRHLAVRRAEAAEARRRAHEWEAAHRAEASHDEALEAARVARWSWDLASDRFFVTAGWSQMLRCAPDEVSPQVDEWLGRIHPDDLDDLEQSLHAVIYGGVDSLEADYRIRRQDGTYLKALARGGVTRDDKGQAIAIFGCQIDIADLIAADRRASTNDLFEDKLTGLPNRNMLVRLLRKAREDLRKNPSRAFAVVLLSIDRFKVINDSLGHIVGDRLLAAVGSRLRGLKRPGDVAARLDGDEFVLLLEDVAHVEDVLEIVEEVHESLSRPYRLGEHEVASGAWIGVALGRSDLSPDDLLRNAGAAMYRAKTRGAGGVLAFTEEMQREALRQCEMQNDLARALERFELDLHYQPIIDVGSQAVCAVEALMRWRRNGELLGAGEFIGMAEELGLIGAMGEWALRAACEQRRTWLRKGLPDVTLSVNVSPRQLGDEEFPRRVQHVLAATETPPHRVQLEITESALVDCDESTIQVLHGLAATGVTLAIDDFGAGHSALSYLTNLPFRVLKLDMSFIAGLERDERRRAIVRGLIDLAHTVGLEVTAEGVESREALSHLVAYRCDKAQGYLFGKPVDAERTAALLASRSAPSRRDETAGEPADIASISAVSTR